MNDKASRPPAPRPIKTYISMDIIGPKLLDEYIASVTKTIKCNSDTKAYIQSIFKDFVVSFNDLSKDSITLLYVQAKTEYNFQKFKNIADWLFYTQTLYPQITISTGDYYFDIAKDSYSMCYRILDKKWPLFQELSCQYPQLVKEIHHNFKSLNLL